MTADMPAARILIVEAETTIARFVSDALKEEGFTVFIEGTLKEGLTACSTRQPDLVVVDLGLPDGDGLVPHLFYGPGDCSVCPHR